MTPLELDGSIFIKHGLNLLNDFRVTFSVGRGHSKGWTPPSSGEVPLSFPVKVNPVRQVNPGGWVHLTPC